MVGDAVVRPSTNRYAVRYLERPVNAECPFCEHRGALLLHSVTAGDAAAHFVPQHSHPSLNRKVTEVILALWNQSECSILRCANCEGCFASPHVAGTASFYDAAYAASYGYPADRWEFHKALSALQSRYSPRDVTVFELGSGDGGFLRLLEHWGVPQEQMFSLEYSASARASLSRSLPRLHLFRDDLEFDRYFAATRPPVNCVAAFHVLEHTESPLQYLKRFHRMLDDHGVITASMPNSAQIEFNEQEGLLLDMPPNHISRFSMASLAALARRSGLTLDSFEPEPLSRYAAVRQYLQYRCKRRSQYTGTFESALAGVLRPRRLRRLTLAAYSALFLPYAIARTRRLNDGGSIFALLTKQVASAPSATAGIVSLTTAVEDVPQAHRVWSADPASTSPCTPLATSAIPIRHQSTTPAHAKPHPADPNWSDC